MSSEAPGAYYVPHGTHWPILGSFGLFFTVGGAALWLNEVAAGKLLFVAASCVVFGFTMRGLTFLSPPIRYSLNSRDRPARTDLRYPRTGRQARRERMTIWRARCISRGTTS